MKTSLSFSVCLVSLTVVTGTLVAQTASPPAAPAQGAPAGGRGAPAPPPEIQTGHGTGKLVLYGDTAFFDNPANPQNCVALSRFERGMRLGLRAWAVDGGTGEPENTAVVTAHLTVGGKTIDIPMRWRGAAGVNSPVPRGYIRVPVELWTGVWEIPKDAPTGIVTITWTARDRFEREAFFRPSPDTGARHMIVETARVPVLGAR